MRQLLFQIHTLATWENFTNWRRSQSYNWLFLQQWILEKKWAMVSNGVTLFHFDPKPWVKNAPQKITIQMLIRWNLLSNEGGATFDLLSQLHLVPCYTAMIHLSLSAILSTVSIGSLAILSTIWEQSLLLCQSHNAGQLHKRNEISQKDKKQEIAFVSVHIFISFFNELSLWAKQWELISPF